MIKILSVNLNAYDDCIEVVYDEIDKLSFDFYVFCGDGSLYGIIEPLIKKPKLYLGFSPLIMEELVGVCSLVSFIRNGNIDFELDFFEEKIDKIKSQNNELSKLLIGYIESKENYASIYYLKKLLALSPPKSLLLISIINDIKPYLDYDYLINKIFTTEIGSCVTKDMSQDIFLALKNNTFNDVMNVLPNNNFSKPLKMLFNDYFLLSNNKDEMALLLYSAMFINLATFSKNRGDISISYLYMQRCVEVTLIYYFLKRSSVFFDSNAQLCFSADSSKIKGVGPLILLFFENNTKVYSDKIWKLNMLRNRSVIGHGLYMPAKSQFNELYVSVEAMLNDLINKCPDKDFFDKSRLVLKINAKSEILVKIKTRLTI